MYVGAWEISEFLYKKIIFREISQAPKGSDSYGIQPGIASLRYNIDIMLTSSFRMMSTLYLYYIVGHAPMGLSLRSLFRGIVGFVAFKATFWPFGPKYFLAQPLLPKGKRGQY
jgi:hypothetical protein